jgi:ArsR family transcriptional regulator
MTRKAKPFSLVNFFRALSDLTRLRLLNLIADREMCVCYFVGILQVSQPKISRHLAYLRREGIVASRRQGKWMHYRVATPSDPIAASILQETLRYLRQRSDLRRDLVKLGSACCKPDIFALPENAPQPSPAPDQARMR